MGVPTSFSSTLSLPPVTPGSFTSAGAPPSLASLLATPLASLGPSRTTPLVLSSALPPIPGKVVEAIRAGHYVDSKDLLPDNVALRQRMVDTGILGSSNQNLRLHEVGDVETWLHCFLAFMAAKVESSETRELMAYGQIILMLVRKHSGMGWKTYDTHFCQLVGAGHTLPWTELNQSMMAADVLQSGVQVCALCQSHDHHKECALPLLVQGMIGAPAPIGSQRCVAVSTDWQVAPRQNASLTINAGHVGHPTTGPRIAGSWQYTPPLSWSCLPQGIALS